MHRPAVTTTSASCSYLALRTLFGLPYATHDHQMKRTTLCRSALTTSTIQTRNGTEQQLLLTIAPGNGCSSLSPLGVAELWSLCPQKGQESRFGLVGVLDASSPTRYILFFRFILVEHALTQEDMFRLGAVTLWNAALLKSSCLESDGYSPTRSADAPSPGRHIYDFPLAGRRLLYMMNVCPVL
ncbi:hypothetical protein BDZ89DRAFT_43906 [Hymenopellis radicata]|nr:hypothetical protein BDZ89DRAFT_43906 [Hymenopellis radicata]